MLISKLYIELSFMYMHAILYKFIYIQYKIYIFVKH